MQKIIARIMAILMLLSVFGQVAAQPCADMHAPAAVAMQAEAAADLSHAAHSAHAAADMPMPANHCDDMPSPVTEKSSAHCGEMSSTASDDCGQACTCCPSHCATVLLAAEAVGVTLPRSAYRAAYDDLASSAEPDPTIKPPRSA